MPVSLVPCRCGKHNWMREHLPPDDVLERECTERERYDSESDALAIAERAALRHAVVEVVRCPWCHGWHLSKEPKTPPSDGVLQSQCKKKKRYETNEDALGAAYHGTRRQVMIRVYECHFCHGWHLTHHPKTASVRGRRSSR
jgi:predicted hydrocarbon binding protein